MKPSLKRQRSQKGFSLIEASVVVLILGVVAAMAIPTWQRMQKNARLNGDAHQIAEALSVAKMRAGANFTYSRVFLYTGTGSQYYRVDVWNGTLNSGNGCWVPDDPNATTCITTSGTTGYETYLSTGVSAGYGSLSTSPVSGITLAQAPSCISGASSALGTGGSAISNTSCILYNSRGFPTAAGGLYITDSARTYGIVTNANGMMHSYVTAAAAASWKAY